MSSKPASLPRDYWRLWTASAISNLGDGIRWTALPLLAASLTRDPIEIAALEFAGALPWLLFALVSGAIVDRLDRRAAMAFANAIRGLLVGSLGAIVLLGEANLPVIYAVAFALGTLETVFDNAAQAILPSVVPHDALETANGRMYAAEIITNSFVGPPAGAFLFTIVASAPFLFDSVSFLVSAALIAGLAGSYRPRGREDAPAARIRSDIAEGLRWLWRHRLLRTLAVMLGIMNALSMAGNAIFVLFALEILDLGATGYGVLLGVSAGGSVLGGVLGARISRGKPGRALFAVVFLFGLATLGVAVTSSAIVVAAMFAVIGFLTIVWNVITVSLRQSIIPDRLLGRVNSVYRFLGWGSIPIGAALGGFLANAFGLRAPFFVSGVAHVVMALATLPLVNDRTIAAARPSRAAPEG